MNAQKILEAVKTALRNQLKREPTADEVARELNGCGLMDAANKLKAKETRYDQWMMF